MNLNIEKVFERDIDLLVINKFMNDELFKNYFLSKIELEGYNVTEVYHSFMDNDGETDITIILENKDNKVGLLIEDKIDAVAMPKQYDRYIIRGNKGIENGLYDKFFIFIIAPRDYLNSNIEAKKYDNKISYEELIDCIKDSDAYAKLLLEKAIEEKKKGYIVIEDREVTLFWQELYKYIREYYPKIKINEVSGPRGSTAQWPEYKTNYKFVNIIQKSDRGYLDLTFNKMASYVNIFNKYLKDKINDNMTIERTNKSMAIRMNIPLIDFKYPFEEYIDEINEVLDKVMILYDLLDKIEVQDMYKGINGEL